MRLCTKTCIDNDREFFRNPSAKNWKNHFSECKFQFWKIRFSKNPIFENTKSNLKGKTVLFKKENIHRFINTKTYAQSHNPSLAFYFWGNPILKTGRSIIKKQLLKQTKTFTVWSKKTYAQSHNPILENYFLDNPILNTGRSI